METPECDKMLAVQDKSRTLSEFLDWLKEKNYAICANLPDVTEQVVDRLAGRPSRVDEWVPIRKSPEELFADYFGIDLKKVEEERRAILKEYRKEG